MIEDLKSKVDQIATSSIWFAKSDCSDAGLDDLSKRSDKTQQTRGRKIPIAYFSPDIVSLVNKGNRSIVYKILFLTLLGIQDSGTRQVNTKTLFTVYSLRFAKGRRGRVKGHPTRGSTH